MSDSPKGVVTVGDFASFSDILVETAIDPIVENTAAEMGYRAALTANTLARTEFEAEASADASIVISCTDNEFLSASLTRQAVMSLRGADVRPQTDGLFAGIIHPFAAFDLLNDNTAGGVIDILNRGVTAKKFAVDIRSNSGDILDGQSRAKSANAEKCRDYVGDARQGKDIVRTAQECVESPRNTVAAPKGEVTDCKYHKEGSEELMRGVQGYRVIDVAGARFIETTTASTFASFPSGSKTGYGTYIVGQDAVFSVSLGATEIPEQRNYQLIVRNWEPSVADPARVVGASCAYNFFSGATSQKCGDGIPANSVNVSQEKTPSEARKGTCREHTRDIRKDEDMFRPAWRHAEPSRNDLAARSKVREVTANKYAAMRVPQSAALHPRFRLNTIGPHQRNLDAIAA